MCPDAAVSEVCPEIVSLPSDNMPQILKHPPLSSFKKEFMGVF
jgi:hypothetical protein